MGARLLGITLPPDPPIVSSPKTAASVACALPAATPVPPERGAAWKTHQLLPPQAKTAGSTERIDSLLSQYSIRSALRPHAANERIGICGARVYGDPQIVTRLYQTGDRSAHWRGVILCGRSGCPVCGELKARKFGDQVRRTLGGGGLWQHVILTIPHGRGDSWAATYGRLLDALQQLTKGQHGRLVMRGLVEATIRATETTHGKHGWHTHFHMLWKVRRELTEDEKFVSVRTWMQNTKASEERGLVFGKLFDCATPEGQAKAAAYVSKAAYEMSGAHKEAKGSNRTLGQVYGDAAKGDRASIALVQEYQKATKARRLYQLDKRAKKIHDEAPELPETVVVQEWTTDVDRAEFSALSRIERSGRDRLAIYLPLETAITSRGPPSAEVMETIDSLLRAYDG